MNKILLKWKEPPNHLLQTRQQRRCDRDASTVRLRSLRVGKREISWMSLGFKRAGRGRLMEVSEDEDKNLEGRENGQPRPRTELASAPPNQGVGFPGGRTNAPDSSASIPGNISRIVLSGSLLSLSKANRTADNVHVLLDGAGIEKQSVQVAIPRCRPWPSPVRLAVIIRNLAALEKGFRSIDDRPCCNVRYHSCRLHPLRWSMGDGALIA